MGLRVLRAYTISVQDQQSLYLDEQHTLEFYTNCMPPMGEVCYLFIRNRVGVSLYRSTINPMLSSRFQVMSAW